MRKPTEKQILNALDRWLVRGGTLGHVPEKPSDHPDWHWGDYFAKSQNSEGETFHGLSLRDLAKNLPADYIDRE